MAAQAETAGEKPPQFVLFSFDGAGSHEHWQRVLSPVKSVNAHFSGFLSGSYLLTNDQRDQYRDPGHRPGKATIGFGGSDADIRTLVADLNTAVAQPVVGGACAGPSSSTASGSSGCRT
ncbi:hypothetical protein AB0F91_34390 [Amycolatopsis sp. NPDC023774]|uniref:hypothetical protein n=1 Tax=Amycolatopsis sp. NPDC023774 TaxID=3155015 RepID=UPI0033E550C6